ncbi:MAG: hypothetical protein EZS28_003245 [Streblomastix strix]|uniref:Uncharacterized protein n=1 Tax=Streblomastix strix TaxID=222440 RepID=A0A5J4X390_9EUKA|nr:MAG: hypothetical protein EZS28_003245 [Streblomastix strix]
MLQKVLQQKDAEIIHLRQKIEADQSISSPITKETRSLNKTDPEQSPHQSDQISKLTKNLQQERDKSRQRQYEIRRLSDDNKFLRRLIRDARDEAREMKLEQKEKDDEERLKKQIQ